MNEKKFIDGLFTSRRESAPEFVVANLSFKTEKFIEWLKQNTNSRGYCNVDIKRNRDGVLYSEVNEWKPKEESNSQESRQEEEIEVSQIPF